MDSEVRRAHDVVAEHLAAVISHPNIVVVTSSVHVSYAAAHVEIVISLLTRGAVYAALAAGEHRTVPVKAAGLVREFGPALILDRLCPILLGLGGLLYEDFLLLLLALGFVLFLSRVVLFERLDLPPTLTSQ